MALTSAEKKKKQEELNRQGKLYLQAKAKGDKRAMAAAHATADKIRKEAGWSYDAKTGTTYEKVSPIQKKGTVVNSKENLAMAKAGANPVKAVQQAAKKSSILTNSPASKSSVQQAKKALDLLLGQARNQLSFHIIDVAADGLIDFLSLLSQHQLL